ncbi:PEP/pyruvate-binding domain-containing protein [Actinoplanes friuliensis]|uniref:Putative phosphoenolpyruvate synthase n=1 Tax=Actinoplanes friuliensis DSM 7358 TaxID=1246995 RepID=U5W154_9ACTN|nr:PEP/pyruvate-binding domain-containing protein [Actinoplanes friuliensis]AGZ41621.1 putative phosphoenolpyruvate synthase [Actinoplanes friuliensis DSM 7358]
MQVLALADVTAVTALPGGVTGLTGGVVGLVGGKAAGLGALIEQGFRVPPGFCVTTEAYRKGVLPEAEILAAYGKLGGGPVAVRSSATTEDQPDASFAGQHDTILDVTGPGALLAAITRCWESLHSPRATAYRKAHDLQTDTVRMAVVVQRMIDASVAGVLFTANPLTGSRTEMVVDAAPGPGSAVVDGTVQADHYVLGASATPAGGCLSPEQLAELQAVGERLPGEVDVEWAFDRSGTLWLLQSRPITTLFPLPPATPDLRVYFEFGHVQGMLQPVTPLGLSTLSDRIAAMLAALGVRAEIVDIGGRLYGDLTDLARHPATRKRLIKLMAVDFGPRAQAAMEWVLQDPRFAPDAAAARPGATMPSLATAARGVSGVVGALARPEKARRRLLQAVENLRLASAPPDHLQPLPAASGADGLLPAVSGTRELPPAVPGDRGLSPAVSDARGLSPAVSGARGLAAAVSGARGLAAAVPGGLEVAAERLRFVRRQDAPDGADAITWTIVAGMLAAAAPEQLLKGLAGPDEIHAVLAGMPHNVTIEMDLALWRLSQQVGEHRDLVLTTPPTELAERFLAGTLPEIGLTAFLTRYGHRGAAEVDLGVPRWDENPAPVLAMIANYLRVQDPEQAPDVRFARAATTAEATLDDLVARARRRRPVRGRLTGFLLRRARALAGLRESGKFAGLYSLREMRRQLLLIGADLATAGRLADRDDIVFATLGEVHAAVHDNLDLRAVITTRKAVHQRELRRRTVPVALLSDGTDIESLLTAGPAPDDALRGVGASAGRATGRARVVLDPATAHLEPGDILVTSTTDPGWTPLFLTAAGLVTETGAIMAHGPTVAREYGIPAVICVPAATTRITDGQLITVDGAAGTVTTADQSPNQSVASS